MPLDRLPEVLRTAFFIRWAVYLGDFWPSSLLYGLLFLILLGGITFLVWRALQGLGRAPTPAEKRPA